MYLTKLLTLTLALFVGTLTALAGTIQLAPFATVDGSVGQWRVSAFAAALQVVASVRAKTDRRMRFM